MTNKNKKIKVFETALQNSLANPSIITQICNPIKIKLTPKEEARQEKILKAYELKEKKRRAKKITMTVGEYEDKMEEVRYNYY